MSNNVILSDLKVSLNINTDDTSFDQEIILLVNPALTILHQAGVDLSVFELDKETKWDDLLLNPKPSVKGSIKSFISLYIRRLFDPATSSFLHNTLKEREDEYLWRVIQGIEYD